MKLALLFAVVLAGTAAAQELTPEQNFQINCAACHAVDRKLVGPSLVEISNLYKDDPDAFVRWCIEPQHKRENMIQMPSMAHLDEATLRSLYGFVMSSAEGKTEVQIRDGDPFAVPAAYIRRPQMQRIFMPDASPAAIAVALPGELSFCFDATLCRLRYVWAGGFIDGWPYWEASGNGLAKLGGDVIYREESFPINWRDNDDMPTQFLGYRLDESGIPVFRYRIGDETWTEAIRPLEDGVGIEREFTSTANRHLSVVVPDDANVESSTGSLEISADEAKSFTLTYRWK